MPLIYAFVARATTVLADYTSFTGEGPGDAAACLCQSPVAPEITGMLHSCLHISYAAFHATGPSDQCLPWVTGNFSTVAIQCLEKCPTDNSKFTFTCDKHTFNYLVDGGYSECQQSQDWPSAGCRCRQRRLAAALKDMAESS